MQSTPRIAMGGLGIRRVSSLAIPAFLASAVGTLALQSDILSQLEGIQDPLVKDLEARWRIESGITIPNSFPTHILSKWDQPLLHRTFSGLSAMLSEKIDQARFL